jgi:hypothetical protein
MNFHLKSSVARQGIFLCTSEGKRFTDPSAYRRLKEKIKMIIQNCTCRFMFRAIGPSEYLRRTNANDFLHSFFEKDCLPEI